MGNYTQCQPFLCPKVVQPRVNLTASPWPKRCRGGGNVHTCLSCQVDLKELDALF